MKEKFNISRAPVPLKWDYNQKKWMVPDQMTVETAFRQPKITTMSSEVKSPTSEMLDGQLLHLESAQYQMYVEEYNRLT